MKRALILPVVLVVCMAAGPVRAAPIPLAPAGGAPASQATSSCADSVTSAPMDRAVVSAAATDYGKVLVIGAGAYAGCSLYLLTSDQLHALNGADYACSDNVNPLGAANPCDSVLWPALLTNGRPIAGPGVSQKLLGTVTRTDLPNLGPVQQVTYAGYPLYRFFLDETPGETEGANLFDPVTSPTGTWYLVDPVVTPGHGLSAAGPAQIGIETVGDQTVLAATMNNDFSVFPNASFPVYTLDTDRGPWSACEGLCALYWQPVLTSSAPQASSGVDQGALGIIVRPDGSHQVTYHGRPLYLFVQDAYIQGLVGTQAINGAGKSTPWGTFNTIAGG